jgi:hypothetical protein
MLSKPANGKQKIIIPTTSCTALSWIAAWAWTIVAGGGGLLLLWTKGPGPLTNGWFALLSGVSACPATGWFLKKYAGVTVSGMFGWPLLLSFSSRGELLWRSEVDLTVISGKDSN